MFSLARANRLQEYITALTTFDCRACKSRKDIIRCIPRPMYIRQHGLTPVFIISSYPKLADEACGQICQTADKERIVRWLKQANFHDTFITTAFKCPTKLTPLGLECSPAPRDLHICSHIYLDSELKFIKPKVVVAFGEKAIAALRKISVVQATKYMFSRFEYQDMTVFSMYHPTFIDRGGFEKEDDCINLLTQAYRLNRELQDVR